MNYIQLQGNLTADPVVKNTKNGKTFTTFNLAVNRIYTNKEGERTKKVTFFRVIAWDLLGQAAAYLIKGQNVIVQGSSDIRNWQDEKQQWHTVNEVVASSIGVSVIQLFKDLIKEKASENLTEDENASPNDRTEAPVTKETQENKSEDMWDHFGKREPEVSE